MAIFSIPNITISGFAAAVPKNTVLNSDIKHIPKEQVNLLIQTTGINSRRVAKKSQKCSDFCLKAAENLIEDLNWKKSEIDVLIYVTQTPDLMLPGNSALLHKKLGLSKGCITLDIHQGCAGYVHGLSIISSLLTTSKLKKGLLLVGDKITSILDPKDMSTIPIFSDGGSATALETGLENSNFHFNLQSDGNQFDSIYSENGGYLNMNGLKIFNFGLKEVHRNIFELFDTYKIEKEKVDFFILHQANKLLNESILRKIDVPKDKSPSTLNKFGNTSCATIPITIVSEIENPSNKSILLSGFGVGLSWASVYLELSNVVCSKLIEL